MDADVLGQCFVRLDVEDLPSLIFVNKSFKKLLESKEFWQLYFTYYGLKLKSRYIVTNRLDKWIKNFTITKNSNIIFKQMDDNKTLDFERKADKDTHWFYHVSYNTKYKNILMPPNFITNGGGWYFGTWLGLSSIMWTVCSLNLQLSGWDKFFTILSYISLSVSVVFGCNFKLAGIWLLVGIWSKKYENMITIPSLFIASAYISKVLTLLFYVNKGNVKTSFKKINANTYRLKEQTTDYFGNDYFTITRDMPHKIFKFYLYFLHTVKVTINE